MSTPAEVMFSPEFHMRVRKYISADTPEELERYTGILYAKKIEFRCLVYSENSARDWSDDGFRVDILMNYKLIDEPEILKALGLKWHQLYEYYRLQN